MRVSFSNVIFVTTHFSIFFPDPLHDLYFCPNHPLPPCLPFPNDSSFWSYNPVSTPQKYEGNKPTIYETATKMASAKNHKLVCTYVYPNFILTAGSKNFYDFIFFASSPRVFYRKFIVTFSFFPPTTHLPRKNQRADSTEWILAKSSKATRKKKMIMP